MVNSLGEGQEKNNDKESSRWPHNICPWAIIILIMLLHSKIATCDWSYS